MSERPETYISTSGLFERNVDIFERQAKNAFVDYNILRGGVFVARMSFLTVFELGIEALCRGLSSKETLFEEEGFKQLSRTDRRLFLKTDPEASRAISRIVKTLSEWRNRFSREILSGFMDGSDVRNIEEITNAAIAGFSDSLRKSPTGWSDREIQECIRMCFPFEESGLVTFLSFLENPSTEKLTQLTGSEVEKVLGSTPLDASVFLHGHFIGISNSLIVKIAEAFSRLSRLSASKVEIERAMDAATGEIKRVLREKGKAERQAAEDRRMKDIAETLLKGARLENSELRRQNAELSASSAAATDEAAEWRNRFESKPVDLAGSDATLIEYAESLESDLSKAQEALSYSDSLARERLNRIIALESRLSILQQETAKARDSLSFMHWVESSPSSAQGDDLVKYLALSDADITTKTAAATALAAFFDRLLLATSKGASSKLNENNAQTWTGCGTFANSLLNPVFNYLKKRSVSIHPQRFLDELCQMEWGSVLDSYAGGEAVAMKNKKDRIVTTVRNLFQNGNARSLPVFSAIFHLAETLSAHDAGDIDLGRLSDNLKRSVVSDPICRHLRELAIGAFPSRVSEERT